MVRRILLQFAFAFLALCCASFAQTKYSSTNQYQCGVKLITNSFACAGYMAMYTGPGGALANVQIGTPARFIMTEPYFLYLNGTQITSFNLTGPGGTHLGTFSYNWTGCTSGGQCHSGTGLINWVYGTKNGQIDTQLALTTYEEIVVQE